MRLTLVQVQAFVSQWHKMRLRDDDLRELETIVLANPTVGKPMGGTGGLRKMRFAPPSWHTGKSGATRVAYVYFPAYETIYWITIYAKQDKDNLTAGEKNEVRAVINALGARLAQFGQRG
jgi:hypothetical protein